MARRKRGNPVHGWVNFDKPLGMTSTQAVGKVRWLYQAQKAGHAGTLDPQASGILPIALGDATKTVPFLVEARKTYICGVKWGERTVTLDVEGEIVATSDHVPTKDDILAAIPAFIGEIEQIPPAYSAIKIDGKRAYDLARAGNEPEMKARTVEIDEIELLETKKDSAVFRIQCGKGTYIRSFARDIAHKLGTEGHVISLRRTAVGPFTENTAFSLDGLEDLVHKSRVFEGLLAVETALDDIPVLAVTTQEQANLKQGRAIVLLPSALAALEAAFRPRMIGDLDASRFVLARYEDKAVALCDARNGKLVPKRVFNL
jgi:tRNA pseudouridine55 synthase